MTVIAWDGTTLAADKSATNCGYSKTITKIFRLPDGLVGFSGDGDAAMDLLKWFRGGRPTNSYPAGQKGDNRASAMFVDLNGRLWFYDKSENPTPDESRFSALGSGRDYALAAMYLGHDARKAVEVACALDNDCRNGIDALTFDRPAAAPPRKVTPWQQ